ncbi:DNA-(apurinic or apyrimidinic site) lyase [Strigomonas culicis]|uniref:DNA-(Apurinic or apyrimidinic site) lyase n=1 Tax=Strigomonas culicis TaxID=28005 RepID=S9VV80_9TRYP|nr:DNA-(apurinic or apyrimidinic site) lyase [Strigomonas culicis]|eukprot:EPY27160.1 DNA-(apurinic or apyrimidinic site) lyase [Strigomonas culicis]
MLLLSWNVAGWASTSAAIRESYGTLQAFFDATGASIICIQECKGTLAKLQSSSFDMGGSDALPAKRKVVAPLDASHGACIASRSTASCEYTVGAIHGWESFWSFSGKQHRGFNGVVTFVKKGLTWRCDAQPFTESELNDEGRVVVTHHSAFVLLNVYVPNARGGKRAAFKARFLQALRDVMERLRRSTGKPIILSGDLNMTYRAEDVCWSLRRLRLADVVQLHQASQQLSDSDWQEQYPCLAKASLSYAYNVISNYLCAQAVLSEAADACAGCADAQGTETKSPAVAVDSGVGAAAAEEAVEVERLKWLKETVVSLLREGDTSGSLSSATASLLLSGATPPVTVGDWHACGMRGVHLADLTRSYPPQHNRDLYSVAQYAAVAPHGDESVLFMSTLLHTRPKTALPEAVVDEYVRANRSPTRMWDSFLLQKGPNRELVRDAVNEAYCPCPYTCWDQSHNCRLSNEGTRIDYVLLDDALAGCVVPRTATENNSGGALRSARDEPDKAAATEQDTFFSELCGTAQRDGIRRAMADGAYPPAPFDGSGMPEVTCAARTLCLRGLPSTGLFVTPPQWSDHIGVAVQLTCALTPRTGKMVEDHPNCMHRPPVGLQSFFAKAKKETEKVTRDVEEQPVTSIPVPSKISRSESDPVEVVNVDSD